MISRRNFLKAGSLTLAGLTLAGTRSFGSPGAITSQAFASNRPPLADRKFVSDAVEACIAGVKAKIKDPKLAWLFENCYPNTLDTTVEFSMKGSLPDTFVITGDIHAMWLRDSSAQVWPYLPLAPKDAKLKQLLAGVIHRQTACILIDPYANAFNIGPGKSDWLSDNTQMKPELHERKYEIDSLCYPVRLAWNYWKTTNDSSVFTPEWRAAAALIVRTFKEQQRKEGLGPYRFTRKTDRQLDTLSNDGWGQPLKPVGLINSSFRPSDDATTYGFLIPSNLFAVTSLKQMAEISESVLKDTAFAASCRALASEVQAAIDKYAIVTHPKYGKVYAFEVDGFGNVALMDDANVPSLLALPYLGCVDASDQIYQNTRNLVWSTDNPYFFKGTAAEGIGGPHIGYDMVWPMSIIIKALTSSRNDEIKACILKLRDTDGDTGFMHESFHKDNPAKFTRKWFAWANTLFGELMIKAVEKGIEV